MIDAIRGCKPLKDCIRYVCEDEGIRVEIDPRLEQKDYVSLKVDAYYSSARIENPPPSIDFIIPVDCVTDTYVLYLFEFKNVKSRTEIKSKEIIGKFDTVVNGFIGEEFRGIFLSDKYKYKGIYAYVVHNLITNEETYPKDTMRRDKEFTHKPYKIKNITFIVREGHPSELLIQRFT